MVRRPQAITKCIELITRHLLAQALQFKPYCETLMKIQNHRLNMPVTAFDHVNVRTAQLDEMIRFYGEILDLRPGKRPDFGLPGAWLYLDDQAYIHLVAAEAPLAAGSNLTLEHFAFRAKGLAQFRALLDTHGITHSLDLVPGFPIVQVNFRDPDGNHIHVDFDVAEMES